jgi:excinuclease ABC subunit A
MFSFNNPYGACPECGGLGTREEVDPERLVPNPARSLKQGAVAAWAGRENPYVRQTFEALAKRYKFSLDTAWSALKKPVRDVILYGDEDGGFEGVVRILERRYKETTSEETRQQIEVFMAERPCPVCKGARLRRESLAIRLTDRSIGPRVRCPAARASGSASRPRSAPASSASCTSSTSRRSACTSETTAGCSRR